MQAKSEYFFKGCYDGGMQTGRPTSKSRPPFGERLHALREVAGLSQQQVAKKLGMKHAAYAWWERHPVALRPEQLLKLAKVFNVTVEEIVGGAEIKRRGTGPAGKMRQLFDAASRLPRSQQQKVAAVLEPFIKEHSASV